MSWQVNELFDLVDELIGIQVICNVYDNDDDKAEGFTSLISGRQTKYGIVVPFGARIANAGNR